MCRVLHSRLRRCLDGYTKASIGPTYKEQAQGQPVQRELRQPCNESPVLPVVGEREPVFCFGIAHSLDVFTKTTEEVVHLLWWKCDLALGFDYPAAFDSSGLDVNPAFAAPADNDHTAAIFEVLLHGLLDIVLAQGGALQARAQVPMESAHCPRDG